MRYVRAARDAGPLRAVVSSSANCRDVLEAAGIADLFEARIDGIVAEPEHMPGKPAPDTFPAGAQALGVEPAATKKDDRSLPSPESLNLLLLSVDGDGLFGQYAAYLESCGIPWAILCDGPVMSPDYANRTPLLKQLRLARLIDEETQPPAKGAPFDEWKRFWEGQRVHTLATKFGGIDTNSTDKSGEIEAFFKTIDAEKRAEIKGEYPSKVRAVHAFAEAVECPSEVAAVYQRIFGDLTA